MGKFAFFYFMVQESESIADAVPRHVRYWGTYRPPGYMGGPFADRSGGLIVFEASSLASADELVQNDPFVKEGLLARSWLKEWSTQ
jgi:uncharacterized protein YciI